MIRSVLETGHSFWVIYRSTLFINAFAAKGVYILAEEITHLQRMHLHGLRNAVPIYKRFVCAVLGAEYQNANCCDKLEKEF